MILFNDQDERNHMKQYKQLTYSQRYTIWRLKQVESEEYSLKRIAEIIGVNKSTVSRELKRNQVDGIYLPASAQYLKNKRREHCKKNIILEGRLEKYVYRLVKIDWSPDQISNTLLIRRGLHISHESIYKYIREDRDSGGILYTHLRQQGKHRRHQYGAIKRFKEERPSVSSRPECINNRERVGDCEIDTMVSKKSKDVLVTLVDRKSRFTIILKSPNSTTKNVYSKVITYCNKNEIIVKSITADNGQEFAGYKEAVRKLECDFFFCHPYRPQERGTNENTNGLIRQYFPKGCSFKDATPKEILRIQNKLNNRPRKCLGYKTPREVFEEEISVALAS